MYTLVYKNRIYNITGLLLRGVLEKISELVLT